MSRIRSIFFVLPFLAGPFAVACGGSVAVAHAGGTKDSGAPDTQEPRDDAPHRIDAAPDTAPPPDAGKHEAEAGSAGPTLLAAGKDFVLWGVTSDGYAIYSAATSTTPTIYAVALAGGPPVEIDTLSSEYSEAVVGGPLVFVLNGVTSTGQGTLKTWSAKGGLHTLTSAAYVYSFDVSSDAQSVTYFDDYDVAAQTGDAYVAHVDGTEATLLQKAVSGVGYPSNCYPELAFAGSSVVLSYCTPPSTMSGNIYSFAPSAWTSTTVASGIYPYFNFDPSGTTLLINTAAGLQVIPVAGGTATTIDPKGQGGTFTSTGADVVYVASSGALMTSPVKSPSPVTLVSSGLEGIVGLSPDDSTALVFKSYDSTTYLSDLYGASAIAAGGLTTLSAAETVALGGGNQIVYGSSFTNDSSHVLYFTGVSTMSYPYLGTLQSSAVGSSASVTLAQNTNTVFASGKTKVVFVDNFMLLEGSMVATVDVKSFDTSTGASPDIVVGQANAGAYYGSFFLSPDGSEVVYTQNATKSSMGGVFVTPVP